ncbi:Hsp20/alpha crystallin family protein [Tellurirhabdus rosea]|uniref:Hsp20/alpha crystallin family protein n=1 Tax=Tellurirhabdus rosea TaxID=2674997 RepID=UPI00224F0F8A|nr:Hsp20/alpha crystallin family protein [Tellurirhabdus rosea]
MNAMDNALKGMGGQIDLLNTLYGGSSMTRMETEQEDDRLVITLSAPGVSPEAFNVLIDGNKLVLYTLLQQRNTDEAQALAVPMFLRVLDIPPFVDAEQIEAVQEPGRVRVHLPFKNGEHHRRRIEIQKWF